MRHSGHGCLHVRGFSCRVIGYTGDASMDQRALDHIRGFSCRVIGYTGDAAVAVTVNVMV